MVMVLSLGLAACKKEHSNPKPPVDPPVDHPGTVTVAIDQSHQGNPISPSFLGLSFETQILTKNPEYLNANNSVMVQLIKTLGPGLLRIGGDTSDETEWTDGPRDASTPDNVLTTTDVDRLAEFSKASGWPVLYGLNMGSKHMDACTDEAAYVSNSLGSNLYMLQLGNEPDIYPMFGLRAVNYSAYDYSDEWSKYAAAIKKKVPQAIFGGPDVANNNTDWVEAFTDERSDDIKLIDQHYYIGGPASSPYISYKDLLSDNAILIYKLQGIKGQSLKYGLPYRITETNSIYGGGKPGASDVFAASLWSLDFMWTVAENNGQGINFHGGYLVYSPITMANGVVTAGPEYYGMLAFKYGNNNGTIAPVTILGSQYNFNAHASHNADGSYSVTLINKEEKTDIPVTVQLSSKNASTIEIARFTAPSITSADNITFAGSRVNADGTFKPGSLEQVTVNKKTFVVTVPAASAAVITVH